MQSIKEYFYY